MPVFGPWVSPRHSVVWFGAKECIGNAKFMIRAKLKQLLTVVIAFSHSKVTETVGPGFIITTYMCIKVKLECPLQGTTLGTSMERLSCPKDRIPLSF